MVKSISSISQEVLDREYRRLSRNIAAELLKIMAEMDIGFDEIASRNECSERKIRMWFKRMTDGTGSDLRSLCNIATAMNHRLIFKIENLEEKFNNN